MTAEGLKEVKMELDNRTSWEFRACQGRDELSQNSHKRSLWVGAGIQGVRIVTLAGKLVDMPEICYRI